MFDLGFFELLLIAAIALALFGPQELLRWAKHAGLWFRAVRQTKADLLSELQQLEQISRHDKP